MNTPSFNLRWFHMNACRSKRLLKIVKLVHALMKAFYLVDFYHNDFTLTYLSQPQDTIMGLELLGENLTQDTQSAWPSSWMVYLHWARVFHSLIVLSREPETICQDMRSINFQFAEKYKCHVHARRDHTFNKWMITPGYFDRIIKSWVLIKFLSYTHSRPFKSPLNFK